MLPSISTRRARLARALSMRWQRRLTFLLGGLAVGTAAVAFAMAANGAQHLFRQLLALWPTAPLILAPAGFALSAYATQRWFPNSQGSGIPQAIAARRLNDRSARGRLVSIRIALGKIGLTLFGLLCGASIGREGPTVQIGASIMFALGRLSPARQPGLILAGSAAGVAAAFNTPLAGIVFAIEEMSRSFEERTSGLIIGGVIAAGIVSLALLGNYTYFGTTAVTLHGAAGWLAVPICGVGGGLLGGLFSRILIAAAGGLPRFGRWITRMPIVFAALCGLGVALCGMASDGSVYGTGYEQVRALLDGGTPPPATFGLMKMAATVLSSISGIPGGIFSPSLAAGAGFGANLAGLFPDVPLAALILLGMAAYFAGVVQAPITAFVIVTEMTRDQGMIVPLMAAAFIASATSRLFCPTGVYHALAKNFLTPPKA